MEGGDSEFANFTLPILKAFLEARSQNVSGNKQYLVARAIGCPEKVFFFLSTKSRSSCQQKKTTRRQLFSSLHPLFRYFLHLQQWWHLYCFAILGSASIVINSVKQHLLRNQPGSDAATSHDFLRERLLRALTRANQLH